MKKLFLMALSATMLVSCYTQSELDEHKATYEQLSTDIRAQLAAVQAEVTALEAANEQLSADLSASSADLAAASAALATANAELDAIKAAANAFFTGVAIAAQDGLTDEEADALQESLDAALSFLGVSPEAIASIDALIDALQDYINGLESDLADANTEIELLKAQLAEADADIAVLQSDLAIAIENQQIIVEEVTVVNEIIENVVETITITETVEVEVPTGITQAQLDDLQSQLDAALANTGTDSATLAQLEAVRNELATTGEALATALANQEDGVSQSDVDAVQALLDIANASIVELTASLDTANADLAAANASITDLNAQIAAIIPEDGINQADLDAAQIALEAAQASAATLQSQLDAIIVEDGVSQSDVDAVQALLDTANARIAELESQLADALAGVDYWEYSEFSGTDPGYGTPTVTVSTTVETAGSDVEFVDSTTTTTSVYDAYSYEETRTATLIVVGTVDADEPTQESLTRTIDVLQFVHVDVVTTQVDNDAYVEVIDADGDGTPDADDAFPNDASEDTDTDGDGIGDNADNYDGPGAEAPAPTFNDYSWVLTGTTWTWTDSGSGDNATDQSTATANPTPSGGFQLVSGDDFADGVVEEEEAATSLTGIITVDVSSYGLIGFNSNVAAEISDADGNIYTITGSGTSVTFDASEHGVDEGTMFTFKFSNAVGGTVTETVTISDSGDKTLTL